MEKSFISSLKTLLVATYNNLWNDNLPLHSAGIAFYSIFSAAPLLVIIISALNFFLSSQQASQQIVHFLARIMGPDMARSLMAIAQPSGGDDAGIVASIVAVVISLFGATTVITQLKASLNAIWEIKPMEINSIIMYLFDRVLSLIVIGLILLFFMASLLLEGGMTLFSGLFRLYFPQLLRPFFTILTTGVSILMTVIFFTLIYKILPDAEARWRDVFVGACVTTVLFLIGKYLVGFYLSSTSLQTSYKTAGSFVIFLIWTYYNVQIVLVGAEFTQTYTRLFGQDLQPSGHLRFLPWVK